MVSDFSELYERHAPDVLRFAVYLTGNGTLAEDLVSEAFLRAWTTPQEVRTTTVKAYLFTIVRNLYMKTLRRKGHEAVLETIPDPAAPIDEMLAGRSELKAVLAGLQQLSDVDRSALLMRALDGMTYEEIAASLDLSVANVKVKVFRARARLVPFRHGHKETIDATESDHA